MILWPGTFSGKTTCTLNSHVKVGPQRGLNTKIALANIKIEESKGIWVLHDFPVMLEE